MIHLIDWWIDVDLKSWTILKEVQDVDFGSAKGYMCRTTDKWCVSLTVETDINNEKYTIMHGLRRSRICIILLLCKSRLNVVTRYSFSLAWLLSKDTSRILEEIPSVLFIDDKGSHMLSSVNQVQDRAGAFGIKIHLPCRPQLKWQYPELYREVKVLG